MEVLNLKSSNFNYENVLDMATCLNIIIDKYELYDEILVVRNLLPSITNKSDTLDENWRKIFVNGDNNNLNELQRIVQYILAIPVNNSYVKGIFSIMNNMWSDERNRLKVEFVKAKICTKMNYDLNCKDFYKYIMKSEQSTLLKSTMSSAKYTFKVKNEV